MNVVLMEGTREAALEAGIHQPQGRPSPGSISANFLVPSSLTGSHMWQRGEQPRQCLASFLMVLAEVINSMGMTPWCPQGTELGIGY